jgi:hypothetical protein
MRSKFFVRAVKRGDYDPLCECAEHDTCDDCLTCPDCYRENHHSGWWIRQQISYFWGPRGDAKPWPRSRMLPPLDVIPCRWTDSGQVSLYRWRPKGEGRKMFSEYSRRRKKR